MYVGVPKDFTQFFRNTFYASYPTSDIIETSEFTHYEPQDYLSTKDASKIFTKDAFVKDGTYMDPMNTLLNLYT